MSWVETLTEENLYALYDVALDIKGDLQLGQRPRIPLVPSVVRFALLMPIDSPKMRDRYGTLRRKAMEFLKSKGAIESISIQLATPRWNSWALLTVVPAAFLEALSELESEYQRRKTTPPVLTGADTPTKPERALAVPEFDKVTLVWLVHHLPLKLWLSGAAIVATLFVSGVYMGQVESVRELFGVPAAQKTSPASAPAVQNRIDQLTSGYNTNVAQITKQILAEEEAAGRKLFLTEQQPHVDAANRLRALLENEHQKYEAAVEALHQLAQQK